MAEDDTTKLDQLYEEYEADKQEALSNEIITLLRIKKKY